MQTYDLFMEHFIYKRFKFSQLIERINTEKINAHPVGKREKVEQFVRKKKNFNVPFFLDFKLLPRKIRKKWLPIPCPRCMNFDWDGEGGGAVKS